MPLIHLHYRDRAQQAAELEPGTGGPVGYSCGFGSIETNMPPRLELGLRTLEADPGNLYTYHAVGHNYQKQDDYEKVLIEHAATRTPIHGDDLSGNSRGLIRD